MSSPSTPGATAYTAVTRPPHALQKPVPSELIAAMARRAFGDHTHVRSIEELPGGEINNVYRVGLQGAEGAPTTAILRVAPPPEAPLHWHEVALMRREHALVPYLAPLGSLVPQTLFADFTRELLPRDYLFQPSMPGENWRSIEAELPETATESLWRELADIARQVNDVQGEAFGYPPPLPRFATWSACVAWELEQTVADLARYGEDTAPLRTVLEFVGAHPAILDAIQTPHLAHGDLWTFNVLVDRQSAPPRITAVLDGDRGYWGDPLADWTFHLLPRKATDRVREVFWQTYGPSVETPEALRRGVIYDAKHTGNVLAFVLRAGGESRVPEIREHLARYARELVLE